MMMKQATRSVGIAAAASVLILAGGAPAAWAGPSPSDGPPRSSEKIGAGHNRAAKKTYDRMHRDLTRLVNRLIQEMREAVQPGFDALADLEGSEPSAEDLDALAVMFRGMLEEAEKAALQRLNDAAAERMDRLRSAKASARLMAKAEALVKRLQRKIESRADRLEDRFEERMVELFGEQSGPDDGSCDHDGDGSPSPEPTPDPAPSPDPEPGAG